MRILAIGGAGFIGRQVVGRLVAQGHVVHVPTRQFQHGRALLVQPTVTVIQADIHDDATLERLVAGCDIVMNFVGILHSREGQPYGPDFDRAHVQLPRRIAQACRTHRVKRFIHISALGADLQGPSGYLRSKAAGEQAIRNIFASAGEGDFTIFRPSVVFGPEDKFMNMFAQLARFLFVLPIAGAHAKMQPVFVGDLATGVMSVLTLPAAANKTYDLAGPRIYTLGELVKLAALWSGHPRVVVDLPMALGRLQAMVFECLPGEPLLSRDNLASLSVDNVTAANIDSDLNVVMTPLESVAPLYLKPTT
ncbi:MAG: complex I NDUFA9 subunit family protein [Alcaligenaceae bacterium]|jgi:NADH dehydrogenase